MGYTNWIVKSRTFVALHFIFVLLLKKTWLLNKHLNCNNRWFTLGLNHLWSWKNVLKFMRRHLVVKLQMATDCIHLKMKIIKKKKDKGQILSSFLLKSLSSKSCWPFKVLRTESLSTPSLQSWLTVRLVHVHEGVMHEQRLKRLIIWSLIIEMFWWKVVFSLQHSSFLWWLV